MGRINQQPRYKKKAYITEKVDSSLFPLMYSEQESQEIDTQRDCAPQLILSLSLWLVGTQKSFSPLNSTEDLKQQYIGVLTCLPESQGLIKMRGSLTDVHRITNV